MSKQSRNTVSMTVIRTGDFVNQGSTTFTVKGVDQRERGQKFFTLYIPVSSVSDRASLSELSLLTAGNQLTLDFEGTIDNEGFVYVDILHSLQVRR
jgi:hypothetical protein